MPNFRVPWFIGAPVLAGSTLMMALALNYLLSDYFIRTFVDEADPLAGIQAASSDADPQMSPAAVAVDQTPTPGASTVTGATNPGTTPTQAAAASTSPIATAAAAATPSPSDQAVPPTATVAPQEPTPTAPPAVQAGIISEGQFRNGDPGHIGSGSARILRDADGQLFLRFENFSVTNGPDLRVYLSSSDGYSGDSLELGKLKGTDGNQNYEIPDGFDVTAFRSALIWCEPFGVLFAIATLEVLP